MGYLPVAVKPIVDSRYASDFVDFSAGVFSSANTVRLEDPAIK